MNSTLRNTTLKILLSQQNFTVGAIEANTTKICHIIQNHQNDHDIIIFPELCITGYPPEDILFRETMPARIQQALQQIARITQDCNTIIGHPLYENGHCYNAASIFFQGECVQVYRKQQLPNHGVFDEQRYFTPGPTKPCLFQINHYRLALCICEDIWHDETIHPIIQAKTELLICINASPFDYDKHRRRIETLTHHAENGLAIVYTNLVGGQDDLVFDGQSIAMNPQGSIGAQLPALSELNSSIIWDGKSLQGSYQPPLHKENSIYDALVLATRDYIHKNGFSGVLLGLSGGVDSALTLAIAVDALGAQHVHAVFMPSRYSAAISLEDAQQQAESMGVEFTVLPIESIFQSFLHTLEGPFQKFQPDLTEENLQARIRGMLLMALSNKTGKLLLSTSNKSETAVGYTTLYGDMSGGFAVLKDVLKTEVYALARYRNQVHPVIPERVLERPPTAELAENQTDQDTLPPYPILDAIIHAYMVEKQDAATIAQQGFSAEIVEKVIKMIQRNEYKRRQAPPGPKISQMAFSREWRYPITNGLSV